MRITIAGTGYVGTVTGACLAYLGHNVTCVDNDAGKIDMLRRGEIPIYEPFLDRFIWDARQFGALEFSTELSNSVRKSEVIFIAVGTPPKPNGEANLTYLETVAHEIGMASDDSRFRVIINKSTVPVGSGNLVEALVREGIFDAHPASHKTAVRFGVASNPEFLREGSAISDSLYPDRVVIGADDEHVVAVLRRMYEPLINQLFPAPAFLPRPAHLRTIPLVCTSLTSAETIKYASNAFLATKIGFANEIANICDRVGADAKEVMAGIGLDSRIGSAFLNAGIGWGGSCFGKDIRSLLHTAREYGYEARILEASLDINRLQRHIPLQKLLEKLLIIKGRTIALFGLAFKPDTDDLRDAPSLEIAEKLLQMGARVRVYDPVAMQTCRELRPDLNVQYAACAESAAEGADALMIITEWEEFASLDLPKLASKMRRAVMIDGRNIYDPVAAAAAGFDYAGIGRRAVTPRVIEARAVAS